MNDDEFDDQLTEHLLAYAEQCEQTNGTLGLGADESRLSPVARNKLQRAKHCLDVLFALRSDHVAESPDSLDDDGHIPTASMLPRRIGRFQILELLGTGGFGIVYRAYDQRMKREVAIKVPRIEVLASNELQQRFAQEAEAVARLEHPNIVTVFEAGTDGVLPYIVSAYYPGRTLAEWLKQQSEPIPPAIAARWIEQLGKAVAHAHERGVLHRDIKPSNVLLVAGTKHASQVHEMEGLVPKLMDFGLAKLATVDQDMTRSGALLGTLRYMPPEQAIGRTKEIVPASDVYSLGAVLYELLTGAPPFAADSDFELARQIQEAEPSRISTSRRAVPIDLETIALKCLAKEPARRYATAEALAQDLQRFRKGEPILARPVSRFVRFRKWIHRYPARASLIAAVTIAIIVLVAVLADSNSRIRAQYDRAVASEHALRQYTYQADVQLAQQAWDSAQPTEAKALLEKYVPEKEQADLRNFEWYYLRSEIEQSSEIVADQSSPVWSLAVDPQNARFATGDRMGIVRLWNLAHRQPCQELRGHEAADVNCLQFTPDGKTLISAADDRTLRIWDLERGEAVGILRGHSDWVGALAIVGDGAMLISGGGDGRVLQWSLPEGQLIGELYRHPAAVRWVVVHPKRPVVVSACEAGEVRVWDYELHRAPAELPTGAVQSIPEAAWHNAAVDSHGEELWAAHRTRLLRWDFKPFATWGSLAREFDTDSTVTDLVLLQPGRLLTAQHEHCEIVLRDTDDPSVAKRHLRGHEGPVRALALLNRGNSFLSGSDDGTVRRWNLDAGTQFIRRIELPSELHRLRWSPDGQQLAVVAQDGQVFIVSHESAAVEAFVADDNQFEDIDWSASGEQLVAVAKDGRIREFAWPTRNLLNECSFGRELLHMKCHPQQRLVLVADSDNGLSCIDLLTGVVRWRREFTRGIWPGAYNFLNDHELVVGSGDGDLVCLDLANGETLKFLTNQNRDITSIDISSDGQMLVVASMDHTIRVISVRDFKEQSRFVQPGEATRALYFDNDRRLFSYVQGRPVILDAKTGNRLTSISSALLDLTLCLNPQRTVAAAISQRDLILINLVP